MNQILSTENLGLISVGFLLIGFIKLILYYKAFNVAIIDYIDPSEIITLFADNIATSLMIAILLSWPYKAIILPFPFQKDAITSNLSDRLSIYFNLMSFFLLIGSIAFSVIMIFLFFRPKIQIFEFVSYVLLALIILIVFPLITLEIGIKLDSKLAKELLTSGALAVSFCLVILMATTNEIRKVKYGGYYNRTVVELENETLASNENLFYVGKTKSFFFFYSTIDKTSIAYSCNKLKCIKYKPNS